jgi:hypothetical protein
VLDNWAGAGLVTESGNESFNVIAHNYVVDIMNAGSTVGGTWERADQRGSGASGDFGTEGVGFWFRGFNNNVRDNVAANCGSYGYTYFAQYVAPARVPLAPGDDTSTAGQYMTVDMNATPILQFSNNEAYGATVSGMTIWWLATIYHTPQDQTPVSTIKDFHVWHVHGQGFFAYEMNRVTFDGLVVRGDRSLMSSQSGMGFSANDYFLKDLDIKNADIQGMKYGFIPSTNSGGGTQTIENSYLDNYINVYMNPLWTSAYRSNAIPPRKVYVSNVKFGPSATFNIDLNGTDFSASAVNLIQLDQLFVTNYNQVAGDNFQVYYTQQDPNYILQASTYNTDGSPQIDAAPVAGLTNQQNWTKYGVAFAGAVAPTNATRTGINGFVQPF